MIVDSTTFSDIARHLHGLSNGLLDGMKKVILLNPETATTDREQLRTQWLEAVDVFVRVNHEVLTLAELLRAVLRANGEVETKPLVS